MIVARSYTELEQSIGAWKKEKRRIAFVPTMGALHEGHMSLMKIGLDNANKCVASIFVNPAQFAPTEDFSSYPREEGADLAKLEAAGVHLVYMPQEKEIYPTGPVADLRAGPVAVGLESEFRPHFFNGVVSVVARLFDQVMPDVAVFGEKDYQQLCVIREMVREMNSQIEVMSGPIIRDAEGLALSSRNAYLSETELKIARRLNKTLYALAEKLKEFPTEAYDLVSSGVSRLQEAGFDQVDYVELREADTLKPLTKLTGPARLLAAAHIGKTRLIDNVAV
ncbi:MAG TPA: pantoate--beta-alanine ligase [Alphaproteobacteria bacterium]|jgi:pantoate--beta-alanine ligase|nr:pantoate--beta-alanine ligase [Micavibrio sp.]MBK9562017.1 pantoate--beta-alanine ligase [Micavibrio sp.]HQX26387.1 pantoate--beta-alanine ligase [Alphaproteobacteria bacterium]